MQKYPKKKDDHPITEPKRNDVDMIAPSFYQNPFLSFRYSYKSISSFGGKTHIRAKEQRFENGKLETEEFEGTTDGNVYHHMLRDMQNYYLKQMAALSKSWSAFFLPFSSMDKD
jgi:hypothetical protein